MTQTQLGYIMGVQASAVSLWETNQRMPPGDVLMKLAIELDIVPDLFPGYRKEPDILGVRESSEEYKAEAKLQAELEQLKTVQKEQAETFKSWVMEMKALKEAVEQRFGDLAVVRKMIEDQYRIVPQILDEQSKGNHATVGNLLQHFYHMLDVIEHKPDISEQTKQCLICLARDEEEKTKQQKGEKA